MRMVKRVILLCTFFAFIFSLFTGFVAIKHNTQQAYCVYEESGAFSSYGMPCTPRWEEWLTLMALNFVAAFLCCLMAAVIILSVRCIIKKYIST